MALLQIGEDFLAQRRRLRRGGGTLKETTRLTRRCSSRDGFSRSEGRHCDRGNGCGRLSRQRGGALDPTASTSFSWIQSPMVVRDSR
ncbi:hypothetical protein M6B38_163470 [Iris pallida]|uniref:Uncharacterized protein n=1 Tax=Iris pallida TaxID=29817 RepID=A0AAX6EY02_IRIPA|nr:hypothetical protein M6B38_163470 [Iris pallida]